MNSAQDNTTHDVLDDALDDVAAPAYATIVEFIYAGIDDDEAEIAHGSGGLLDHEDAYFTRERMMADCAAKRQIVADHADTHTCPSGPHLVSDIDVESGSYGGPCGTLRALAAIYADRPGYLTMWKPVTS